MNEFPRSPSAVFFAEFVPKTASIRSMRLRNDHVFFLPYSPRGMRHGLWLERNPYHPRIWGWLAGVPLAAWHANPRLIAGAQIITKRCKGEVVAHEAPAIARYPGHRWDMIALPVEDIQLIIEPALVNAATA